MKSPEKRRRLQIALVSVTMGQAQRGYERLFRDLFELLRSEANVTLFMGGGKTVSTFERVPRGMRVAQKLARMLPLGLVAKSEYPEYKADCLAFAISLIPELLFGNFDIVHLVDFPLGHAMRRFPRAFGWNTKLLMTNACCMRPEHYPTLDCIQEIALPQFEAAITEAGPNDLVRFLPIGFHAGHFVQRRSGSELRARYGIPPSTFVILSVAAIKRTHKRLDHLISEASKLSGNFLLWLDGNPESEELAAEANQLLGPRCRISLVPSRDVRDLYHIADVMVHAALEEAFGLSVVEGLSTGLTVLTHNSPHFRWLTGNEDGLIDMTNPGELTSRLQGMIDSHIPGTGRNVGKMGRVIERFDWQNLKQQYLDLYGAIDQGQSRAL